MEKKLRRSREHRVISGVMGGLAEHFDTNPLILRIILVIFVLGTGIFPGVIAYIFAALILPEGPAYTPSKPAADDDTAL